MLQRPSDADSLMDWGSFQTKLGLYWERSGHPHQWSFSSTSGASAKIEEGIGTAKTRIDPQEGCSSRSLAITLSPGRGESAYRASRSRRCRGGWDAFLESLLPVRSGSVAPVESLRLVMRTRVTSSSGACSIQML